MLNDRERIWSTFAISQTCRDILWSLFLFVKPLPMRSCFSCHLYWKKSSLFIDEIRELNLDIPRLDWFIHIFFHRYLHSNLSFLFSFNMKKTIIWETQLKLSMRSCSSLTNCMSICDHTPSWWTTCGGCHHTLYSIMGCVCCMQ